MPSSRRRTRATMLAFICRVVSNYDGPHLGAFVLPEQRP